MGASEKSAHLLRAILSFLNKSSHVTSRIFGIILGSTVFSLNKALELSLLDGERTGEERRLVNRRKE